MNTAQPQSKKKERWAAVAVSRLGVKKALEVAAELPEKGIEVYTLAKYQSPETRRIVGKIGDFFGELMAEYDTLLCIMATGIVVRSIAPHLGHKSTDPGILVMDTDGRYVISLLSGHLGHANENTLLVAKRMGAQGVITTGTDVKGSLAVDVLAEKIGCRIADFTAAKEVTAAILDEAPVLIINEAEVDFTGILLPPNLSFDPGAAHEAVIWISDRRLAETPPELPTVQLVPQSVVVGIGCRRGTLGEHIIDEIQKVLAQVNIHPQAVTILATIGLKADEKGIHAACQHFGATLKVVPDAFVKMVQSHFEGSDFVYKTTGLYAVSEPCGYVASGFGTCLLEKKKCDGVTLSLWKSQKDSLPQAD